MKKIVFVVVAMLFIVSGCGIAHSQSHEFNYGTFHTPGLGVSAGMEYYPVKYFSAGIQADYDLTGIQAHYGVLFTHHNAFISVGPLMQIYPGQFGSELRGSAGLFMGNIRAEWYAQTTGEGIINNWHGVRFTIRIVH